MARDVVGVRVRLEHALDPHAGVRSGLHVLLDRERRVDHDGTPLRRVTDEVGRAAEVLVHELAEEKHAGRA